MRSKLRYGVLKALRPLFSPGGYQLKGCRFLRSFGPVMQVVRFDTLRDPDMGKWVFRVYAGSTTARMVDALNSRVYPHGVPDPDPEHGPLFFSTRSAFQNRHEPFSVSGEPRDNKTLAEVEALLVQHVLPFLDRLRDPDEIVELLERGIPVVTSVTDERMSAILSQYKESSLGQDKSELDAAKQVRQS